MKIGIFTLHSNTNFGGGLQQIALVETLRAMGHEPQVVCVRNDSRNSRLRRILGIISSYSLRGIIVELKSRLFSKKLPGINNTKLYKRCDAFNYDKLNYTPKFGMAELPEYCKRYDAIIVGSDQVWTNVYSAVNPFFGDGIGDFKGRVIAYAACSAHHKVPYYNRRRIHDSLSRFSAISVRDNTSAQLVESIKIPHPKIVADPTLLYDYEKYLTPADPNAEPYIFAYVLGIKSDQWHADNIKTIRQKLGNIKVIALSVEEAERFPWADEVHYDKLAIEWMNLLRHARFVYTNSYHAVLFALKFHKEFVAYYGDLLRSSRMLSLREKFHLESQIVKEPAKASLQKINFNKTDAIIEQLREDSLSWLKSALKA